MIVQFELKHLESYDDDALLEELRRVAALVPEPKLKRAQFDRQSKVSASTVGKRFGGWQQALVSAGLAHRFEDSSCAYGREELLAAIRAVAVQLNAATITRNEFTAQSGIDGGPIRRVFGSWNAALSAAGFTQSALGRRYDDEQCYENLLNLWIHYGRPPQQNQMSSAPSLVGSKAYIRRWGTWRRALAAFVARANETSFPDATAELSEAPSDSPSSPAVPVVNREPRDVPLGLRYYILKRDRFRCVNCGKSPANDIGTVLHVDHIHPWSKGGATVAENLRVLCMGCNLGKGASHAEEI